MGSKKAAAKSGARASKRAPAKGSPKAVTQARWYVFWSNENDAHGMPKQFAVYRVTSLAGVPFTGSNTFIINPCSDSCKHRAGSLPIQGSVGAGWTAVLAALSDKHPGLNVREKRG